MRMEAPACEGAHENAAVVTDVLARLRDGDTLTRMSNLMRVIADGTRMRILAALDVREICVCDLAAILGMTKSAVSHQLRVLREEDLVRFRRDGRTVYYSLADDHVRQIFERAAEHVLEEREEP